MDGRHLAFHQSGQPRRVCTGSKKYVPQYARILRLGISQGKFFDGDPNVWKIVDGKLYVNYNKEIEKAWEQDIPGFVATVNRNWPRLIDEEACCA